MSRTPARPRACIDLTPLSTGSRFRGIGTYALALGRALAALDAPDLELLGAVGRASSPRILGLADAVAVALDASAGPPVPYGVHYALSHTVLAARLLTAGVDLLHATDPKGAPRLPGLRTLTTCHDLIPTVLGPPYRPDWVPDRVAAAVDTARYRLPHGVVAISEHTRDDLVRITGISPRRVTVIPHGVDHAVFRPDGSPGDAEVVRRWAGRAPFFLYVGGFDARKGVPALVGAFGRVAPRIGESLVIVGQMRPAWEAPIRAAISASGAADRVILPGFVPAGDLPALYRAATAHATPSSYEGFGMTVLEAFACGCPVVAADASCTPEIAGDAALLVPAGDEGALSDALLALARDPEQRADRRARGLARARQYTWERCARRTLDAYRATLGRAAQDFQERATG